ncbi:MAG: tetratricopeptide repeat protein [Pseudomonadota bacterium]
MHFETIYKSETVQAFWNRGAAPGQTDGPAFVTFEGIGLGKGKTTPAPFGSVLAEKLGLDLVHVVPRAPDWYHYPDMDACLAAVRPHMGPRTFAYGSSMGGFASARFADRLGLTRALCLSPQYSIQPAVVPFETRWQKHATRIDFLNDDTIPPRAARVWILTDVTDPQERAHAELIAQSGPTEVLDVSFAGHPVGTALREARALAPIMEMFLEGREDPAALRTLLETTVQERSVSVLVARAAQAKKKDREALLRKALELKPDNARVALALGIFLLRTKRVDEAHTLLKPIFTPAVDPKFAAKYSRVCSKLGLEPSLLPPATTAAK